MSVESQTKCQYELPSPLFLPNQINKINELTEKTFQFSTDFDTSATIYVKENIFNRNSIAEIRKKAIEKAKMKTDEELGLKKSSIPIHDIKNFKYLDSMKTIKSFEINDNLFKMNNLKNFNNNNNNSIKLNDDFKLNLKTPDKMKTDNNSSKLKRSPSCLGFRNKSIELITKNENNILIMKASSFNNISLKINQNINEIKDELSQVLIKKKFSKIEEEIKQCKLKLEETINLPDSKKSSIIINIEKKTMERMVDLIEEKTRLVEQLEMKKRAQN